MLAYKHVDFRDDSRLSRGSQCTQYEDETINSVEDLVEDPDWDMDFSLYNHTCEHFDDGIPAAGIDQMLLAEQRIATWPTPSQEFLSFPIAKIYNAVKETGVPNQKGARMLVKSRLDIDRWMSELGSHPDDKIVTDSIRFGFSLQYTGPPLSEVPIEMHKSGRDFMSKVQEYIDTESAHSALAGPFSQPPFSPWCRTSPIMTRPKGEGDKRRVIVDLSYPPGNNVNEGVTKNNFFGKHISHVLPRISDVVQVIVERDFNVAVATVDIRRAYRNFPGCPLDLPLNVIKFNGSYFIDLAMPFGARTSSCYMQKIANAISRALARRGIDTHVYLDDLILYFQPGDDPPARMKEAISFIKSLGLPIADEKVQCPSGCVKYLGIWLDIDHRLISMPDGKITKFLKLVEWLMTQKCAPRKTIQSLIGKIVHQSSCVPAARTFVNQVLDSLRGSHNANPVVINDSMLQDLRWFRKFLRKFNGRSMMKTPDPAFVIEADACLVGAGATDFISYIAYDFPPAFAAYNISVLEALNCLVACRMFLTREKHASVVKIKCDNLATIHTFERGAPRDKYLAAIARALWYCLARADVAPVYEYTPGLLMTIPDTLSRISISHDYATKAAGIINDLSLQRKEICSYHLDFHDFL